MTNINLSTPEHAKSNIQKYLVKTLPATGIPAIDLNAQNTFLLLQRLEVRLWMLAKENREKLKKLFERLHLYSKASDRLPDILNRPKVYLNGSLVTELIHFELNEARDQHSGLSWFLREKLNLILIDEYLFLSKVNWIAAAKSLAREFNISHGEINYSSYTLDELKYGNIIYSYDRNSHLRTMMKIYSNNGEKFILPQLTPEILPEMRFAPLNLNLIELNPDAVVILTDNMLMAKNLQYERCKDEFNEARKQAFNLAEKLINDVIESYEHYLCEFLYSSPKSPPEEQLPIATYKDSKSEVTQDINNCCGVDRKKLKTLKESSSAGYLHAKEVLFLRNSVVWSSYVGSSVEYIENTDWTCLANHDVVYVHYGPMEQIDFLKKILKIHECFSAVERIRVYYAHVSAIVDEINLSHNKIRIYSSHDLLRTAFNNDLQISDKLNHELAEAIVDLKKPETEGFLIDNILDRGSLLLLSAQSGVGKSLFAQNLGYALATRGRLINGWRVNKKCKVLYFADNEVNEETFMQHRMKFKKLYGFKDHETDFSWKLTENFDLSQELFRKEVENELERCKIYAGENGAPVNVLILDSLNKLAPSGYQEKNWEEISSWLTSLKKQQIAIILVHHSSKEGSSDYLGTSKIKNDVDTHIHLECDTDVYERGCIPLKMYIRKNRRSWLDRKVKKLVLAWDRFPRWREEGIQQFNWRAMSETEKIETIIKMRQNEELTSKDIAVRVNRSPRTIEKFIFDHPEIPRIKKSGKSKSLPPKS